MSTVLIVDDDPAGRETLLAILEPKGYTLVTASNGLEALAQAEKVLPDLILLDIMMPGMDGYEVCKHIRENPLLAQIPIVILTALDDRSARLEGIDAGADDFLAKPIDRQELAARVQTITRLNRYRTLLEQREGLRQMAVRVVTAQEEERQRISRDLHDDLGQSITALSLGLRNLLHDLPVSSDDLSRQLGGFIIEVDGILEKMRTMAQDLRPPILDTLGFQDAVDSLCQKFSRLTDVPAEISIDGELPTLSDLYEITLYRILQEALSNITKHAHAHRVWVDLAVEGDQIHLTVQDDGIGFVPNASMSKGLGLSGIQERLALVGGRLDIRSKSGRGTVLLAMLPAEFEGYVSGRSNDSTRSR